MKLAMYIANVSLLKCQGNISEPFVLGIDFHWLMLGPMLYGMGHIVKESLWVSYCSFKKFQLFVIKNAVLC